MFSHHFSLMWSHIWYVYTTFIYAHYFHLFSMHLHLIMWVSILTYLSPLHHFLTTCNKKLWLLTLTSTSGSSTPRLHLGVVHCTWPEIRLYTAAGNLAMHRSSWRLLSGDDKYVTDIHMSHMSHIHSLCMWVETRVWLSGCSSFNEREHLGSAQKIWPLGNVCRAADAPTHYSLPDWHSIS